MNGTVLIIDDEDTLRVSVAKMLLRKGFSVFEAGDGAVGVHLFQTHAADLDVILLDLTLPGMSGAEVLGELRRMRPDIKIVLTTAYGRDRALAEVGERNLSSIRKPYHITDHTALIRKVYLKRTDVGSWR
jgi:CheY-like chemotaxis protein